MAGRRRFVSPVLIGRGAELGVLADAGRAAIAARGGIVLVSGPAGMGKSSLLRRAAEELRASGLLVLEGAAGSGEATRAFGPFVDVLRAARAALKPETFDKLLLARAYELRRLLPELIAAAGLPPPAGAAPQLLDSFGSLLTEVAARTPLAILLDDLHDADEASLDLVAYLSRRIVTKPILLVLAFRSEEPHRTRPRALRFAQLERGGSRIDLAPLDAQALGAMVGAILGGDAAVSSDLAEVIYRRSEGNPFFAEELLKAMATTNAIAITSGRWAPTTDAEHTVPDTVRAVVEARLADVAPEARRVLRVASVIGHAFDLPLLSEVAGVDDDDAVKALRAAIEAQLLDEAGSGDRYHFRHALTREAVLGELLRHEQARLHQAIGEAVERRHADDASFAEELAYHFDESGDQARALRYHEAAAVESRRRFAFKNAIPHLERAIELRATRDEHGAVLRARLGEALEAAGDQSAAITVLEEAASIYRGTGDHAGEARMLALSSGCRAQRGDMAGSTAEVRRAIALLEPLGESRDLARVLAYRAFGLAVEGHVDVVRRAAEQALPMARRFGDREAEGVALDAIGVAIALEGRVAAMEYFDQGLAFADEEPYHAEFLFNNAIAVCDMLALPLVTRRDLRERQRRHATKYGLTYRYMVGAYNDAFCAGRWEELSLYEGVRDVGHVWAASARVKAALVSLARDGPTEAATSLRDTSPTDGAFMDGLFGTWMLDAQEDLRDDAEALYKAVLGPKHGGGVSKAVACLYGITSAFGTGSVSDQATWLARIRAPMLGERESALATALRVVADAHAAAPRDVDRALELMATAVAPLAERELRVYTAVLHVHRARMAMSWHRTEAARAAMSELIEFWSSAGATWLVAQLRRMAGSWKLRIPRPATHTGHPGVLTAREREVAHLIADGLSNKGIAEKLVLSERTVESHVDRIRRKLDVRGRAQIAVWVERSRATGG